MTTLIISTPWYKKDDAGHYVGKPGQLQSWETYLKTGIGLEYILYPAEVSKLQQSIDSGSCKLVMLRQDKDKRRAEARLTKLVITPKKGQNQSRYDVHFVGQKEVPYAYSLPMEKLKWNGVKVI
jgi:hypothetical protein